jgi:hypothetical protein
MDKAPEDESSAIPVCLGCLAPVDRDRHYCKSCGHDTGQFTTYLPYVDIPWMAAGFGAVWRRIWSSGQSRWFTRAGCILFLIVFAPVMFVGAPNTWLARRKNRAS